MTSVRYQLSRDDVAWSSLGDEVVIIHMKRDQVHLANSSAGVLVDALLEGATVDDLTEKLTACFEVDSAQARKDVEKFLGALLDACVIAPKDT